MKINPDRYQFTGKVSAGGMANVLCCQDTVLERKVAIKLLPKDTNIRRIRDELSALLKMRSKHVVQVYDLLEQNETLAIVQEYISGKDLFSPEVAPLDSTAFLKLIWQIASGIEDIHMFNVIHRDIKPNNMKIDTEGLIKIFDFGLARNEGPEAATMGFVGTPGFAAPELYFADPKFSSAVDVYAFGCTALYLGLQKLPEELLKQPPERANTNYFTSLPFSLDTEVRETLHQCLNHNIDSRPKMEQVRSILSKHLLQGRHKALIVFEGNSSYLDFKNPGVSLHLPSMGNVDIRYDGFCFRVINVEGDVFINNSRCTQGHILPGACVITLGAPEHKNRRKYITFDLAHPEIVL